jgi:uncharacterized protein (TIGR02266 family)
MLAARRKVAQVLDEQRKHKRVRAPSVLVRVATLDRFRTHYLRDLSEGGLFIRSERLLPIGSQVEVKLVLPGSEEPLVLPGEIVRHVTAAQSPETGMGVRFGELPPPVARSLKAFVDAARPVQVPGSAMAKVTDDAQDVVGQLSAVRAALQARARELSAAQTRLNTAVERELALSKACDELRASNSTLKQMLEATEGDVLGGDPAEVSAELDRSRLEAADLKARLAEVEGHLEAYRSQLEKVEEEGQEQRAWAVEMEEEKRLLLESLAQTEANRRAEAKQRESSVAQLSDAIAAEKAARVAMEKKLAEVMGELLDARQELAAFAKERARNATLLDEATFVGKLREGSKIGRTEKFHLHTPTDSVEARLLGWLEAVDSLKALVLMARGNLTEQEITRLFFLFYQRGVIELA